MKPFRVITHIKRKTKIESHVRLELWLEEALHEVREHTLRDSDVLDYVKRTIGGMIRNHYVLHVWREENGKHS